jgi:hypothetical protein
MIRLARFVSFGKEIRRARPVGRSRQLLSRRTGSADFDTSRSFFSRTRHSALPARVRRPEDGYLPSFFSSFLSSFFSSTFFFSSGRI